MNKEEIEKRVLYAKSKFWGIKDKEQREGVEILLEIINHLETKVKEEYTRGYIERDTEAQKICRECKYIKRVKELEEELKVANTEYEDIILNPYKEENNA